MEIAPFSESILSIFSIYLFASFVRYNKATNDYVIAKVGSRGGIVTMFKPKRGEAYYLDNMKKDGIRQ